MTPELGELSDFEAFTESGRLANAPTQIARHSPESNDMLKKLGELSGRLDQFELTFYALRKQNGQMQITIEQLHRRLSELDKPISEVLASLSALGRRLDRP